MGKARRELGFLYKNKVIWLGKRINLIFDFYILLNIATYLDA